MRGLGVQGVNGQILKSKESENGQEGRGRKKSARGGGQSRTERGVGPRKEDSIDIGIYGCVYSRAESAATRARVSRSFSTRSSHDQRASYRGEPRRKIVFVFRARLVQQATAVYTALWLRVL